MTRQDSILIERLWNRLTGRKFVPQEFVKQVHWHGGHDMSNLSEEDLLQLLEGRFSGNWHEPAFSFSELLAFYSVPNANRDRSRTKEEIVGWVFASFVIADAIKQSGTDWEMQFNLFMNGFLEVRSDLEIDEAIEIFQRVFHRDEVLERADST
jgi:hypothetical protein